MTTLRSSWPSRLRQLLSSEGAIGPSVKVDTEPVSVFSLSLSLSIIRTVLLCLWIGFNEVYEYIFNCWVNTSLRFLFAYSFIYWYMIYAMMKNLIRVLCCSLWNAISRVCVCVLALNGVYEYMFNCWVSPSLRFFFHYSFIQYIWWRIWLACYVTLCNSLWNALSRVFVCFGSWRIVSYWLHSFDSENPEIMFFFSCECLFL